MARSVARVTVGLVLLGAGPLAVSAADASEVGGRFSLELEYLGENYYNEMVYDLPLPDDLGTERFIDTTRYADDTWLPGERLELDWVRDLGTSEFSARSTTGHNAERFLQEVELRARLGDPDLGHWVLTGRGGFRDEERSFVGEGDWHTELALRRESSTLAARRTRFDVSWEHSRTRGDTTSFLYDFDLFEARATLLGGEGWIPAWEVYVEGARREITRPATGTWTQGRGGVRWRPSGFDGLRLDGDLRYRDYEREDETGKDFAEAAADLFAPLHRAGSHEFLLELDLLAADYVEGDDLYYDYGQLTAFVPWVHRSGDWRFEAGPRARVQRDFQGGGRHYLQGSLRGTVDRAWSSGGFAQLTLEGGYRDYAADTGEVIELTALSTSLLRSDFHLFEAMLIVSVPLGAEIAMDLLANTSFESHPGESERIHITFATLSFSRGF